MTIDVHVHVIAALKQGTSDRKDALCVADALEKWTQRTRRSVERMK